jgi:hypothetical protein
MSVPLIVMPQNANQLYLVTNNSTINNVNNDHNYQYINNNSNINYNQEIKELRDKNNRLENCLKQLYLLIDLIEDKFLNFIEECNCLLDNCLNKDIKRQELVELFDKYKKIKFKNNSNDKELEVMVIEEENNKNINDFNEEIIVENEEKSKESDKKENKNVVNVKSDKNQISSKIVNKLLRIDPKIATNVLIRSESMPNNSNKVLYLPLINNSPVLSLNAITEPFVNKFSNDLAEEEGYKCKYETCDQVFKDHKKRYYHYQTKHKPKPKKISCTHLYCKKKFISQEAYNQHMNRHLGIETCEESLEDNHNKKKKRNTIKKHKCDFKGCELMFTHMSLMKKHYNEFHLKVKKFFCSLADCEEGFTTKRNLESHIAKEHGFKIYKCTWNACDQRFTTRSALAKHYSQIHMNLKKFKCNECEDSFATKLQLQYHRSREHNAEKLYSCDWPQCTYSTMIKKCLNEHKCRHTGEKPFICQWAGCESTFRQKVSFQTHMRIHTGEKPFKCDHKGCDKAFRYWNECRIHKNKEH